MANLNSKEISDNCDLNKINILEKADLYESINIFKTKSVKTLISFIYFSYLIKLISNIKKYL
jgi:hypothetical protein